jgi:hypothetical protein
MPEENVTASRSYDLKSYFFGKTYDFLCPSSEEGESYRNLLELVGISSDGAA